MEISYYKDYRRENCNLEFPKGGETQEDLAKFDKIRR